MDRADPQPESPPLSRLLPLLVIFALGCPARPRIDPCPDCVRTDAGSPEVDAGDPQKFLDAGESKDAGSDAGPVVDDAGLADAGVDAGPPAPRSIVENCVELQGEQAVNGDELFPLAPSRTGGAHAIVFSAEDADDFDEVSVGLADDQGSPYFLRSAFLPFTADFNDVLSTWRLDVPEPRVDGQLFFTGTPILTSFRLSRACLRVQDAEPNGTLGGRYCAALEPREAFTDAPATTVALPADVETVVAIEVDTLHPAGTDARVEIVVKHPGQQVTNVRSIGFVHDEGEQNFTLQNVADEPGEYIVLSNAITLDNDATGPQPVTITSGFDGELVSLCISFEL